MPDPLRSCLSYFLLYLSRCKRSLKPAANHSICIRGIFDCIQHLKSVHKHALQHYASLKQLTKKRIHVPKKPSGSNNRLISRAFYRQRRPVEIVKPDTDNESETSIAMSSPVSKLEPQDTTRRKLPRPNISKAETFSKTNPRAGNRPSRLQTQTAP